MSSRAKQVTGMVLLGMLLAGAVWASECIRCHTDTERLKELAALVPKKAASSETAGKG